MMRTAASLAVLAVALAACSGAQSDNQTEPPANSGAPVANTAAPAGQPSVPVDNPVSAFGSADNTAVVVIGDQRYEFANLYCVTLAGAMGASSVSGDPKVNIDLPPQDWETSGSDWDPPSIRIQEDDPYLDLQAGNVLDTRVTDEQSLVDSFTSDGKHATGTATFLDMATFMIDQSTPSVSGTFEVTCGS
jgi:hypothetical protein